MPIEPMSLVQDDDVRANCEMNGDPAEYYIDLSGTLMLADEAVTNETVYQEYKAANVAFLADKVPSNTLIYICKANEHPAEIAPNGQSRMALIFKQMKDYGYTPEQQEVILSTLRTEFGKASRPTGKPAGQHPVTLTQQ